MKSFIGAVNAKKKPHHLQRKKRGLGAILARVVNKDRAGGPEEQIKRNIQLYYDKPAIDPDSDPLLWWANEKKQIANPCRTGKEILVYMRNKCAF